MKTSGSVFVCVCVCMCVGAYMFVCVLGWSLFD